MLIQGADPNAKNHVKLSVSILLKVSFLPQQDGKSPLMLAAEQGNEQITLLLLDHGANVDLKQAVDTL